jgi:hypothetical protein
MANLPAPGRQRLSHSLIALMTLLSVVGAFAILSQPSSLARWSDQGMYLPFVAKPVPTPTLTPTATPLPPIPDVRVEGSCSSFQGGSRQDPNGEYVCFVNYDSLIVDMTGWRVDDASEHSYTFPPFFLNPGALVRLHSGPGADTATDLHWGRGLVWNNDHDTVYLYDTFERLVSRYVY